MDFTLAIVGAQLIDGVSQTPIPSSTVLIGADGRIAALGPSQGVAVPAGVPTIQASGKTLLPGLIDGHVHLTWDKSLFFAYSSQVELVFSGMDNSLPAMGTSCSQKRTFWKSV